MARTMCPPLEAWLNSLSASDRRVHIALADCEGLSPQMRALMRAIVAEILADEFREAAVLRGFEDEHAAHVAEVDAAATWPNGTPSWAEFSARADGEAPTDGV